MNRQCSAFLALVLTLLFSVSVTQAQQTTANDNKAELREKAFQLLDSLAGQIGSLQSAENRARMGSNIAGSLWPHDEERARTLFASVAEDIKLGLQGEANDREAEETRNIFLKLREDTAERIAQRDPELALSFLQRTERVYVKPAPQEAVEKEQSLKLRLARRVATKNPEIAVKLARQSLELKLHTELLALLIRVGSKDKQQAQALQRDIVDKLRDANITNYYPEWDFTQNFLRYFTPPVADDVAYREAVGIVINRALAEGCSRPKGNQELDEHTSFCIYVGALLPDIEKYAPAQAGRMRQWIPEQRPGRFRDITQGYAELNELSENGTVDEILALRSKYADGELHAEIYRRAVSKAQRLGDTEQARRIASEAGLKIDEDRLPPEQLESELAKLQKELPDLPVQQQFLNLLGAGIFLFPQDQKTALKLLKQADTVLYSLPPGREQTQDQMMLAMGYCFAHDDRGFAIMESVVPKLNELIAAGAKLDGYETRYLRDGEWNMTGKGTVGNMLTRLSEGAGFFAWCDFDRAVTLTTQFERGEIRMMAQLKLAQAILAGRAPGIYSNAFRF